MGDAISHRPNAATVRAPLRRGIGREAIQRRAGVRMNAASGGAFQWLSPLGFSVILFLIGGGLYILIGVVWAFVGKSGMAVSLLIVSARTDTIVFGQAPPELLHTNQALDQFRSILFAMLSGLLLLAGILEVALAWFGLRDRQGWALAALALGGIVVLPYWLRALRPYLRPEVGLRLGDVPPFMWVPAFLLVPATILGLIGLA